MFGRSYYCHSIEVNLATLSSWRYYLIENSDVRLANSHYYMKLFQIPFHSIHTILKKLHSSVATAHSDVTLPLENLEHNTCNYIHEG